VDSKSEGGSWGLFDNSHEVPILPRVRTDALLTFSEDKTSALLHHSHQDFPSHLAYETIVPR
jgi:hypothetical protein